MTVQPVIASDVQKMSDFGMRYESLQGARPTPDEQSEQYPLLKLHLVMTAPKTPSEPPYDEEMQKWVAAQLVARWGGYGTGVGAAQLGKLRATAAQYAAFAAEYKELPFTREPNAYRTGGAVIAMDALQQRLAASGNVLRVALG